MTRLPGSTLASRNAARLTALALGMTPSLALPKPLSSSSTAPANSTFPSAPSPARPARRRPGRTRRPRCRHTAGLGPGAPLPTGSAAEYTPPPARSEPRRTRPPGLVEDRARRRGHLAVETAALPPRVRQPPPDDARTVGADEPLRPAQPVQIVQALPVLVEPRPQLRVRPRVVPASRMLHDHLSRVPKWRPPFVKFQRFPPVFPRAA